MKRELSGVIILLFFVALLCCGSGIKLQFQQPTTRNLIGIKRLVVAPCEGSDGSVLVCDQLHGWLNQSDYFLLSDSNQFSAALEQYQLSYDNIKGLDSLSRTARFLEVDAVIFSELKSLEIQPDEHGVEAVEKRVWTGEYERDEKGQIIVEVSSTGEKTRKKKFKLQTVDQHFRVRKARMNVHFQLVNLQKYAVIFSQDLEENYTSGKIIKEESQPIPTDDEIKQILAQNIVARFFAAIKPAYVMVKRPIESGLALLDSGAVHARANRWHQAQKIWGEAEKLFATDARVFYNLGLAAEAVGDFHSAETYYQKAALLNPKKKLYQKAVHNIRKWWQKKL